LRVKESLYSKVSIIGLGVPNLIMPHKKAFKRVDR
jgi:hypothetical protein